MSAVPLRDEQTAVTRQRIVRAMADLLLTEHPAAFSVPAVAERAGVSVRTVYRYFPTKERLLDGVAELAGPMGSELVGAIAEGRIFSMEDYLRALPELFDAMHQNSVYMRAQATNPILRETRSRRIADRRERIAGDLRSRGDLTERSVDKLTSLIQVLGSSFTMLDLVEEAGHDPGEAAELAQWAIRTLVDAATRDDQTGGGDADK